MKNGVHLCESPIEEMFWEAARKCLWGLIPQVRIGPYRVDFAIPSERLVIELDGYEYHATKEQRTHDARRERFLGRMGWQVIRFTGTEIYEDSAACADEVWSLLRRKYVEAEYGDCIQDGPSYG